MSFNKEEHTFDAIFNLVGGALAGMADGAKMTYGDGQTPPTQKEIDAELVRMNTEWDAQEYARNRAAAYPNMGDQMDMIYKDMKNSTTTHADAVEVVKTKWPKDNSGPVE